MRLGIYLDMRNPEPWAKPWPEFYEHSLELAVRAEDLGLDSVWLSEHHFFSDGYLPQPLTMAAAVAARTSRVRIGTAIVVAPLRHAVQLAEEAAVVDILSGGRLELGLGAGYVKREFDAFGVDPATRYRETDQRVRDIRDLLGPGGRITPPAVQQPLPIWLGYGGPKGAARCGRLGAGLLSLNRGLLEGYLAGLEEGGHDPSTARMGGVMNLVVADDPATAREAILPHFAHQLNTYREGAADGSDRVPREITVERLRERPDDGGGVLSPLIVATPDDAVQAIKDATEGIPATDVYFWVSIAGMPDELVDRHVELLATEVAPRLQAG